MTEVEWRHKHTGEVRGGEGDGQPSVANDGALGGTLPVYEDQTCQVEELAPDPVSALSRVFGRIRYFGCVVARKLGTLILLALPRRFLVLRSPASVSLYPAPCSHATSPSF